MRIKMEYFGLEHFMDLTEIVSADDQFLENAVEILEKELDNHELSVDRFAKELAMSRVQLHRKMKAIIGCSASEFIRQYRIKKANEYLKAGKGSVSEIAYSVGFNNLSYFTKSFKEVYKINPSEVQEMS
ncbi:MAG: helix-turn-helix domain-containing protein [Fulvivirga sp.]